MRDWRAPAGGPTIWFMAIGRVNRSLRCRMICGQRKLFHDDMKINVPGFWFMSWYDVSVGPNIEMFNHVRRTAKPPVRDQQWAVIAPVAHCAFTRATENTIVGERNMGDARLDYNDILYGFFDKFLKGDNTGRIEKLAKVTYYTMGSNTWQTSEVWPPAEQVHTEVVELSGNARVGLRRPPRHQRARRRLVRHRQYRR